MTGCLAIVAIEALLMIGFVRQEVNHLAATCLDASIISSTKRDRSNSSSALYTFRPASFTNNKGS